MKSLEKIKYYATTKDKNLKTELLLPISAISTPLNIHQRTLRIYEEQGLLIPKRTQNNRRSYSINDFKKAQLILFLTRNLAFNLSGVKILLVLLNKVSIDLDEQIKYIKDIALEAGFNEKIQQENIIKTGNKGRKAKD